MRVLYVLKWSTPAGLVHDLMGWFVKKMVPKWSGTIRKFDLVGVGVALLEEVCCCGGRF